MRSIGGRLTTSNKEEVSLEREAFEEALRSSAAARFVENAQAFLQALGRAGSKP